MFLRGELADADLIYRITNVRCARCLGAGVSGKLEDSVIVSGDPIIISAFIKSQQYWADACKGGRWHSVDLESIFLPLSGIAGRYIPHLLATLNREFRWARARYAYDVETTEKEKRWNESIPTVRKPRRIQNGLRYFTPESGPGFRKGAIGWDNLDEETRKYWGEGAPYLDLQDLGGDNGQLDDSEKRKLKKRRAKEQTRILTIGQSKYLYGQKVRRKFGQGSLSA